MKRWILNLTGVVLFGVQAGVFLKASPLGPISDEIERCSHLVSDANESEALLKRQSRTVQEFFANYRYLVEDPSEFWRRQNLLFSDNLVVYNRNFDNQPPRLFYGKDGYRQSLEIWGRIFSIGDEFNFSVVEHNSANLVVLIATDIYVQRSGTKNVYLQGQHSWMESFSFDEHGKISRLDVYMNLGRDVSRAFDRFGMNLAMRAAARGDLEQLKRLTESQTPPLDLSVVNPNHASVLYYVAQAPYHSVEISQYVRSNIGERVYQNLLNQTVLSNGHTVAFEAVFHINEELVRHLLDLRAQNIYVDFATPSVFGWTPQLFAQREQMPFADILPVGDIKDPSEERLAWMKRKEAQWRAENPEAPGQEIIKAVQDFDVDEITRLVNTGAQLNAHYGRLAATPLNSSVIPAMSQSDLMKAQQVQKTLLQLGADPNFPEGGIMMVPSGFREAVFGYAGLLQQTIDFFAEGSPERHIYLDYQGPLNGYTKLIDAALRGNAEVIVVLINAGADKTIKGHNGLTAYDAALRYNRQSEEKSRLADEILSLLCP